MKICPVCGTENEDSAQNCQLCNFEFDIYQKIQSEPKQIPAEKTPVMQKPVEESVPVMADKSLKSEKSEKTLYVIIAVLIIMITGGAVVGYRYFENQNVSQKQADSSAETKENSEEVINFSEESETIQNSETTMPEYETIQRKSTLLSEKTGTSSEKVYSDFYQILQDSDAPGGYLYDFDHDGKDDMILKDTDSMDFILYTHDDSGNLYMSHFGSFLAWGNDDFYDVTGADGTHYIRYHDESMQRIIQGYFDPQTRKELNLPDSYSSEEMMALLSESGFMIDDDSSHDKIDMLYYDALCQKTAPPETAPPTEKRNPPEIWCEIKTQKGQYEGFTYTLSVSGTYDYYYVTCYEYGIGDSEPFTTFSNKKSSSSSLYLTAASSLDHVTASVTPYYSDGTEGKTVTCTVQQPEDEVQVYSCYETGAINGRGVAGFTTSYVVDGGAKTTVRDTLGDGWHVTAYNYCYAYGLTWYELYDTDDGDYYGWVDSNYILFY